MGLTSDLSQEELARAVAAARSGKPLSDGPILTVFQPEALADAIERECARTAHLPNQKMICAWILSTLCYWRSFCVSELSADVKDLINGNSGSRKWWNGS